MPHVKSFSQDAVCPYFYPARRFSSLTNKNRTEQFSADFPRAAFTDNFGWSPYETFFFGGGGVGADAGYPSLLHEVQSALAKCNVCLSHNNKGNETRAAPFTCIRAARTNLQQASPQEKPRKKEPGDFFFDFFYFNSSMPMVGFAGSCSCLHSCVPLNALGAFDKRTRAGPSPAPTRRGTPGARRPGKLARERGPTKRNPHVFLWRYMNNEA
eukprot:gene13290-9128_t